jgi:hypothetical protein
MTRQEMKFDQAIPNRNLQQIIDDYIAQSAQIKVTVVGSEDEKVWPVKVHLETSIREIKAAIARLCGIPAEDQTLHFGTTA